MDLRSKQVTSFSFDVVTVNARGEIVNQEQRQARSLTEDLGNGVTLDMVAIPGGTFTMGASESEFSSEDSERPLHQVTIQPFFMGKYHITQEQWQVVATFERVNCELDPDPSRFKTSDRPVETISWYEAVEFCNRLSKYTGRTYRLPSESEWEYACRAGTTTPFHFGETITTDIVNYNGVYTYGDSPQGKYRGQTTPAGSFGVANAFGLYDMHGLLWEWCSDRWHENYEGAPTDGSAWLNSSDNSRVVLRGGSWDFTPWFCRSAFRFHLEPKDKGNNIGFRVVQFPTNLPPLSQL
ncbi:SUMF1/EgtB/PvdO family nonheme iron enzyme [Scytonema sp. UIC 10036]|uniref:SUMF1/EgtB/PvdO family nonheme iron enzyme n=1 Tax=Scytonema sp. UIC 10036 TaxID=2304196 RepID=UPI0012DAB914|nr:SUMF1/EgtB/PvdO family nonheme iron enzyme [Scytonema sp. UIC 10036]